MRVGVPAEVKSDEYRVALTPAGALELARRGHDVVVEHDAGAGSGIADEDFARVGARIGDVADAWAADLVLKVKEPQPEEFAFLREDQVLFTYLHLAANPGRGAGAGGRGRHRDRVRDGGGRRRPAAAAGADERDRRAAVGAGGRPLPGEGRRRARACCWAGSRGWRPGT